jgi:hypothetical protein
MGLLCCAAKIYRPLKIPCLGFTCYLAALATDGYLNRFRAVKRQFDAKGRSRGEYRYKSSVSASCSGQADGSDGAVEEHASYPGRIRHAAFDRSVGLRSVAQALTTKCAQSVFARLFGGTAKP